MENMNLEIDAFVRAISVNIGTKHSILLGAGASITSGIPSAESCIWEWKRAIFLTNNPTLEKQFIELSLESVRKRIQEWLDGKQKYPELNSEDEYGFYIEECYKPIELRRKYFEEKIRHASPHIGYQLLSLLAEAELFDTVWTTNFDSLVSRAAANFELTPIEIGIDTQERLLRTPSKGELICVSLHGDYRYDKLKNTLQEVQSQEEKLINGLISQTVDKPLVICGYSGRDKSIMDALTVAYSQGGRGALYWCGFGNNMPPRAKC
jgi:SIR2-like domain